MCQLKKIKGSVDAKTLWVVTGEYSAVELIFEHQLFHDLETINTATAMLIDEKKYNKNDKKSQLFKSTNALQVIFQIRHTLSHNYGRITKSDQSNFKSYGIDAKLSEIIDPRKDKFGISISRCIENEAEEFTKWLLDNTAKYLERQNNNGVNLKKATLSSIEKRLGINTKLRGLNWV